MARTPVGIRPQPATNAALFAYFAARLRGVPVTRFGTFFREIGIVVGRDGAMRAMRPHRYQSPEKQRAGRKSTRLEPPHVSAFRDWVLIDESAVGVEVALIRFPGRGKRQSELIDGLHQMAGVRQVIDTAHARDVYAFVLFRGMRARRELRARIEELAEEFLWDDVMWESQEPAIGTWERLARDAAAEEGLTTTTD